MMDEKYTSMLPAHRRISDHDKSQMKTMKKVGIKTPDIYGYAASQVGGYQNVRYSRRDLYNEQLKDKEEHTSNAKAALDFLHGLRAQDDMMFWRHTVDREGRLEHIFWCDGVRQRDYSMFGDVLARIKKQI